jgi:uncharacterized membrane protein
MGINIAVMTMFAVNIGMRASDISTPPGFAIGLSAIAVAMLAVSGWLGGELVHILGISVVEAGPQGKPSEAEHRHAVGGDRP